MLRVLVYIVIVFLISVGLAWLADRPGDVILHWQGYEIRTSLVVAALAAAVIIAAIIILWTAIRAVIRAPRSFESYLGRRRRDRGYKALSDGMIAVGAGDLRSARKAADESRTLLGAEPLPLLLTAQTAQLAGDAPAARTAFEALAARPESRVLGLHGLFIEARRQGEHEAARHFAEQAAAAAPKIGWAGMALFEYHSRAGEWLGAMRALEANLRAGAVDKQTAQRERAALLTARAMELEAGEPQEARAAALEAHRLAPSLAPAAVTASRLLSRASDYRRAARVLETAWRAAPHPDIADAYAAVRPGDSVRDRLKRMRQLAELRANHPEGAMAVARAAIDAHDFDAARGALDGLVRAGPSEAVCLLMAEIEEREHADEGKVRMWLARAINAPRDPVWMADGHVFPNWAPVSPVSGQVGVFEWTVPSEAPPSRVAVQIEADLAREQQMIVRPEALPQIEARSAKAEVADPAPAVVEPEPAEPAEITAVAVEPVAETPAVADKEASKAPAVDTVAEPELEPEPATPARPEAAPPPTTRPNGPDGATDEEPPRPPSPDDPGPLPANDDGDEGRPRRFRLF